METFELYLLKSVTSLSLLYCFYWFVLRNETYYSWNRIFLLVSLIVSFFLPFFNIHLGISLGTFKNILQPVIINEYITTKEPIKTFDTLSILSVIYISGAVFFCLRLLLSIAKIHFLYFRFPKCEYNGFKAVILDNDQSAFTFFNILFISRFDYDSGNNAELIVHETAHKDEYHSFDIILLEVMTIIQWFNPFIWLFRHSLKSEHEFIADNRVLLEGFDKVNYQKLLFEKSLGVTSFDLTCGFNYSLLKKRLKMMTIKKSGSLVRIKYLLSMPVLLLTFMLLTINFSSYGQKDEIYTDVDVMAKYKNGGMEGIFKFIAQNIIYPKSAVKNNVAAKIFVQFIVDENGKVSNAQIVRSDIMDNNSKEVVVVGYKSNEGLKIDSESVSDLEAEAIRVVKLLGDFTPAQKNGKNVKTSFTFPISFLLTADKKQ